MEITIAENQLVKIIYGFIPTIKYYWGLTSGTFKLLAKVLLEN